MGLFTTKNYASIVSPLKKIVSELTDYIAQNNTANEADNVEIAKRQESIAARTIENDKSNFTIGKINDLMGADLDENDILDVEELPTDSTDSYVIEEIEDNDND